MATAFLIIILAATFAGRASGQVPPVATALVRIFRILLDCHRSEANAQCGVPCVALMVWIYIGDAYPAVQAAFGASLTSSGTGPASWQAISGANVCTWCVSLARGWRTV